MNKDRLTRLNVLTGKVSRLRGVDRKPCLQVEAVDRESVLRQLGGREEGAEREIAGGRQTWTQTQRLPDTLQLPSAGV